LTLPRGLAALACALIGCSEATPDDPAADAATEPDAALALTMDAPGRCSGWRDCLGDRQRPACDVGSGRCVECTAADERCAPADHCEPDVMQCAPGCRDDDGCASPTPRCDVVRHECVACTAAAHCPGAAACVDRRCAVSACPAGRGDCNRDPADGCEVDLTTDVANCGACGARRAEACNLADDDCDGVCDDLDGCRVGVHRSVGAEHFYTTSRAEAQCCGFRVETYDYFYLYAAAAPGAVALYRCYGGGRHFYTSREGCEGVGASEGVIGYIATSAVCGATPLYRMRHPGSGDNFYTVSAPERDHAEGLGYTSVELAGYVWTRPRG
jgi:hypothetical protein